jgi:phosphatidylglycerol:prolipoprotein diacylglycerol transferase
MVTRNEIMRRNGPIPVIGLPELLFHGLLGGVIGARLGYAVFYAPYFFLQKPWEILAFWHGGMSAHGWLIGMAVGGLIFIGKHRTPLRELADVVYLGIPLGIVAVKIGNLINCEGFGRVTTLPWGIICSGEGHLPRHPCQLYEAIFEGLILFAVLWRIRVKSLRPGDLSSFFLVGYGIFRFLIEFTAKPVQLPWLMSFGLTEGQVLSLVVVGVGVLGYAIPRMNYWVRPG